MEAAHALLAALDERDRTRAQRPLLVLGFAGPLLWLLITALFGGLFYNEARRSKERELLNAAQETNYYAAQTVASKASEEVNRYFRAVETTAEQEDFLKLVRPFAGEQLAPLMTRLADARLPLDGEAVLELEALPAQQALKDRVNQLLANARLPQAASWFVCDSLGTQIAAAFRDPYAKSTVGHNYAWRTYFHSGADDLKTETVDENGAIRIDYGLPDPADRLSQSRLSAPFQSQATKRWKVAVTTPLLDGDVFLGVLAVTVDVESFVQFSEGNSLYFFAVLADGRPGRMEGMILKHPAFDKYAGLRLPERFSTYRADLNSLPRRPLGAAAATSSDLTVYHDPFGKDPDTREYDKPWIAIASSVSDTGLVVFVQQDRERLIEPVRALGTLFLRMGMFALLSLIVVVGLLWFAVTSVLRPGRSPVRTPASRPTLTAGDISTLPRPSSRSARRG